MRRSVVLTFAATLVAMILAAPAASWTWPADGPVVRAFSLGDDPYAGGQHRGVDIAGDPGSNVRAPAAGTVSFAGTVPGNGRTVTIQTADGYAVTLVGLGSIGVAKNAVVSEGETVGTIAPAPGDGSPANVHLGIRIASNPNGYVDPLTLLPGRMQQPAAGDQAGDGETSTPASESSPVANDGAQISDGTSAETPAADGSDVGAGDAAGVAVGATTEVVTPVPSPDAGTNPADGDSQTEVTAGQSSQEVPAEQSNASEDTTAATDTQATTATDASSAADAQPATEAPVAEITSPVSSPDAGSNPADGDRASTGDGTADETGAGGESQQDVTAEQAPEDVVSAQPSATGDTATATQPPTTTATELSNATVGQTSSEIPQHRSSIGTRASGPGATAVLASTAARANRAQAARNAPIETGMADSAHGGAGTTRLEQSPRSALQRFRHRARHGLTLRRRHTRDRQIRAGSSWGLCSSWLWARPVDRRSSSLAFTVRAGRLV